MPKDIFISVVVTVYNEEKNMPDFLDSFVNQGRYFEVIIVDAGSGDNTQKIVRSYEQRYDFVKLEIFPGTRGESRNRGIEIAKGDVVAFIDGDTMAHPFWLKELRKSFEKFDVVGGKIVNFGYQPFVELGRVEIIYESYDLSLPSCNLAFKKEVLADIGGFDPVFITAEDMDLNLRAVKAGYSIEYNENAIVYHHARSTVMAFIKQAFWNGVGRKQLEIKHGNLWGKYDIGELLSRKTNIWYFIRMGVGIAGYIACTITRNKKYFPAPAVPSATGKTISGDKQYT